MTEWIVPALLALNGALLLWLVLRPGESGRQLRDEAGRETLRRELHEGARATRQELGATLAQLQQTLLTQSGDVARTQNEQIDSFRTQLATLQQGLSQSLQALSAQLGEQLRGLGEANERRLAEVRQTLDGRMAALQEGNEKKLEQMRATVDEKLHATL
jgi:DNA recombination protein RmuC